MTTTPKKYSGRIRHSSFVDMTGQSVGRSVVITEVPSERNGTRWQLRCPCGGKFALSGSEIRVYQRKGRELLCHACRPRRPGTVRRVRFTACTECGQPGHNRSTCPRRKRAAQKRCAVCEGMPWRRETPRCRGCGEVPGPEPERRVEVIRDERTWP